MEWVETTGRTIEAARELALDQLGVDAAEAEFETLEEPKSGLFGRTRGVARVRARVSPKAPRPKAERRRRAPKRVESSSASGSGQRAPARQRGDSGRGDGGSGGRGGRDKGSDGSARTPDSGAATEGTDDVSRGTPSGRQGRGGAKNQNSRSNDRDGEREQMDIDEQIQVLETFTTELAANMGLTASASSQVEDNQLTVNLSGEGLGFLVGPRLVTLDAVQEIARNTLQRQAAGREYAKVVIDVEGIRARRRTSLDGFVRDAAAQVRDDDVEVVFDVMSSPDRKQVHDLVAELDGVESVSEGEDPRRRVVLRPAE